MVWPIRQIRMRLSSLLLITTMLGFAVVPFPQTSASASCAAPYLKVTDRLVLQPGSTVTIEGRAFTDGGCQDSMGCTESLGCDSCTYDGPSTAPMDDVSLQLVQRGRTWALGVADAGSTENSQLGWVSWTFKVPPGVKPGPARLLPENAQPVRVRVG